MVCGGCIILFNVRSTEGANTGGQVWEVDCGKAVGHLEFQLTNLDFTLSEITEAFSEKQMLIFIIWKREGKFLNVLGRRRVI